MYESLVDHFSYKPLKPGKSRARDEEEAMESEQPSLPPSRASEADIKMKEMPEQQTWKPTTGQLMVMVSMAISSLMVALDATILVSVLPTLAVDLNGTAAMAFWTGTSYLLTHAVLQPFIASLSDIFGRRELLIPSITFFAVGSIICGAAGNFTTMLAGRVVQGVGGAGIITLSQIIFADMVPLRFRPKYFNFVLGAWAVGSLLGPLIGGAFVEKATWRWCFYLNLPICGVALPMAFFFVRLTVPATDLKTKLQSVDWIGNIFFIGGLTLFLIAISWAGIQYEWSDWQTILPLLLGIIVLVLTIVYEVWFAKKPFLTKSIFSSHSAIASYVVAMFQGLCLYMVLYYSTFYFASEHFFSPIRTGVSILPATVLLLPGSAIVSGLITRFGKFRWAVWAGWTISTLASGLYLLWDEKTSTPVWAVCECLFGLGMGMILSSVNFSIQAVVEPEDAGQAAAMYAFMRSIGMTLGVAIGGTVFQNLMKQELVRLGVENAMQITKNAESFIEQLRQLRQPGQEALLRQNILDGYTHGFRGVWAVMTGICALGLVVSLFIKRGNLDRALQSRFQVRGE
ncbi:hypothetical protein H2198_003927 [Neophaeococcomyces mojaviensis]|uniref:Uncharacterized protein n=1 Tax=Neophaeococcomyces mojaviensis TaxID=3383035 RepID=A0ACC3AA11_9EURO|nr:hypothetical protein H2198_003927 [Knufia sp. JES_112]